MEILMAQKSKPARKPLSKVAKAPVAKSAVAKTKPVAKKPAVKAKATPVPVVAEQQIAKAKAALKKENAVSGKQAATAVKADAPKARGRKISVEIGPNEAASALSQKWSSLYKKSEQIEAKPYNMKNAFEEKTAIVHKVLGWGYILANRNDRLEVLFKDGIKYLISNYKP